MRIGFFGGSFDPVHIGHLILAEQCREQARLDQVWFVPAAQSPLKNAGPTGTNRQRLEMLQIAIAGHEHFAVNSIELDRGGVSFTVDTLRALHAQQPEDERFLLLGGDSLADFHRWREPAEICRLARPLVYARPGAAIPWAGLSPYLGESDLRIIRQTMVHAVLIEISSTEIRSRIAAGRSIRYLTPRAVEKYIQANHLYLDRKP